MHEEYGWKAHQAGLFIEWRDEVSKRIIEISPKQHMLEGIRDDISREVFHELVKEKKISTADQLI